MNQLSMEIKKEGVVKNHSWVSSWKSDWIRGVTQGKIEKPTGTANVEEVMQRSQVHFVGDTPLSHDYHIGNTQIT